MLIIQILEKQRILNLKCPQIWFLPWKEIWNLWAHLELIWNLSEIYGLDL